MQYATDLRKLKTLNGNRFNPDLEFPYEIPENEILDPRLINPEKLINQQLVEKQQSLDTQETIRSINNTKYNQLLENKKTTELSNQHEADNIDKGLLSPDKLLAVASVSSLGVATQVQADVLDISTKNKDRLSLFAKKQATESLLGKSRIGEKIEQIKNEVIEKTTAKFKAFMPQQDPEFESPKDQETSRPSFLR